MTDNSEFCDQMAKAIVSLGTGEALACMTRRYAQWFNIKVRKLSLSAILALSHFNQ
ncbi:hypothetical protein FMO003_25820 [Moritella sp. F3]|nr:hypothetical protein FMO001_19090 [Moritella sp. F1]GIC82301.1 hypothetical protein FMO003_25820 [Moritella sp. F3]